MAGRKSYYTLYIYPNLERIKHWISEGWSHDQIINMLGISKTTFYKYQPLKPEFKEVMEGGKAELGIKLEKALYKEAEGFEYVETHTYVEESYLGTKTTTKTITKYARANASLLIFALCNKFPEKWRRVDKDIIDALESGKVKLDVTDKYIKDAFKAMYPAIEEKDVDKIVSDSKKYRTEDDDNEK